jgi:uncharacterized protein (UPF0147 family)
MTVKVDATGLDKVKKAFQVINDVTKDERVPAAVRDEIKDKMNSILEDKDA